MPSYYYNRNKLRGGSYEDLHLSGSVSMLGPIKVDVMRMNGDFFGEYTLKVGTLHATGSMRVPQMRCTSAFWYGNSAVRTKLQVSQHLSISGQFIGEGSIIAPVVRMNGTVSYSGPITAKEITAYGTLTLGQLDANAIHLGFSERGLCAGIKGKQIVLVPRKPGILERMFLPPRSVNNTFLTVSEGITGDNIVLEHVITNTVSGNDVIIGPGCKVNKVYYRDHIYIDEAAFVSWYEPLPDTPKQT
ncbi:MAG: hypothetical protein J5649_09770 [Lachnospiraceae bacterium]|nr:hypothetical protein [Lachnospiraceae bacterium]